MGRAELQPVEGAEGKRRGSGQKGKLSGRRQNVGCSSRPGSDSVGRKPPLGTSLVVQWLRLHAANEGSKSLIRELRSHMTCGMLTRF